MGLGVRSVSSPSGPPGLGLAVTASGGVECLSQTAVGSVDTTIYTVPTNPALPAKFLLSAVLVRLHVALVGAGTVTITVGTTLGGNEVLVAKAITSATAAGTVWGLTLADLGAALVANDGYNAVLSPGAVVRLRATTSGVVTTAPTFRAHVLGLAL